MSNHKARLFLVGIIPFFLSFLYSCQKEVVPIPEGLIEVEIASNEVNDTYVLRIHLPESYNSTSLNYPVLYQLDGNTTTGSVIRDYENLKADKKIDELIIVSVDYKNENQRVRDFTPTAHSNFDESGGAASFLNFLRKELIPMINDEYRTDTNFGNTLRGHSLGGLFGSYVLFKINEQESVFSNFIIESPSWWWDDNYIIGMEYDYALNFDDLPVNSYFSAGELEGATIKGPLQVIEKRISERAYPNFKSKFEILDNQTHLDVRENPNGLIAIFGK